MKNFLKSTAIFACIALLVCACETDDTETGVGAAPEGVFFLPGANRAMVSWTVPEDSDVEGYSVTWKDSNGNSSKTSLIKVAGSTEPTVTQLSEIPVGTLTATLTPMSGSGGSTTLTTTVYDASTYEEKIPVVYDVDFDSTSLSAEIEWGSIDMDCLEIEVSYTDIYGEEVSTGRAPIDDNMILSNIQAGDSITYVAYFCPAGGLDEVRQYVTTSLDSAPYAPTDVSVSAGVNRIVATWVLDFTESDEEEDEDSEDTEDSSSNGRPGMSHQELVDSLKAEITGTIIRCVNTRTEEVTVATVTMDEHTDSLNNYEVTLVPGDYEVSVFTMKESGATSSVLDATATVTVYSDLDYLKTDSFQASIASTEYLTSTAQSTIYWDYAPTNSSFVGVEVTYVGFTIIATPVYTDVTDDDGNVTSELTSYEYSASTTETSVQTTACTAITADSATATYIVQNTEDGSEFYNAIANETFTYASCFCPEGGLDTIRIYSYETPTASANADSFVFVEADPLAATSVELTRGFTTGEDGVEAPYVTATCSIEDVTDIANYVLEVAVDGVVDESYTTVYEASELEIDADLAVYLVTYTIEDAKIGSSYEVSLTSVTSSFTQSTTTSEAITTYNTETYSVLEPNVTANCNDAVTVTVLWNSDDSELYDDISNVAVLYGNQSNDYSISQLRSGISLTLLSQDLVNTLYYTVTYTPANSEVSVTVAQASVPVRVNPTAPSSIVTTRGYNTSTDVAYIDATVEITEIKDIAKYVVDLSVDGVVTENYLEFTDIDSYLANGIDFRIDNATVGAEYIASIYAVDIYDSESNVMYSDALEAYNSTTYTTNVPAVYAENSYDNVVIATWSNVNQDMTGVVVSYGSKTYSDFIYSELTNFVELEDTTVPESFSYTMTFCPSSGTVPVSLTQTVEVVIPEVVYDIVLNDEGVYEIYTGTGLEAFAAIVNGSVYSNDALVQSGDIVFVGEDDEDPVAVAGANGIMMANVSLSGICNATNGVSWTPIGDSSYTGTFDGNGMIVSGLYLNTSGEINRGLFGIVTGATIKNLKLSNVDVTFAGTASPISGSLVGLANGASYIYGCEVSSGSVNITSSVAGYCGGVIGRIGAGTTVENCINRASITAVMQQAGGVVGNVNASYAYIKGCINYGTMNVANYSGGIVGYFWQAGASYTSEITDCHNYGEINSSSTITGGIAGSIRCASGAFTIEGCTNSGTVTTVGQYIGGLIGYAISASVTTITNCTNYGAVTSAAGNVGGILGWENVATGTLTITECNNHGALQGTTNIGGIMGTSKATVSIVGPGYNYGSITATTSNGGGIIGTNAGTVSNYINKGLVTIAGSPSNGTDANGIYGTNSGTVTNCVDEY